MEAIDVKNLKFTNKGDLAKDLRDAVSFYFIENKISPKGDWRLFSKAIFFFTGFWFLYCVIVFTQTIPVLKLVLCVLSVFFASGIGFSIMHDGSHGSFSEKKWVNTLAENSARFLGVEMLLWHTKHNIIHHTGTNINHVDDDIEAQPLLRLHPDQKLYKIHRFQNWYWPFAYSLLYFAWIIKDFVKYFNQRVMGSKVQFKLWDHVLFWLTKLFFVAFFILIPIKFLGWEQWLVGFSVFCALLGLTISTVFQLAHIVRGLNHPVIEQVNGTETFEHQISTTADFSPNSWFVRLWTGGLNYQIEHHLFRKISHIHHPNIQKIVIGCCKEHNFPILIFPSFFSALKSHVGKLKDLGQKPK
jgi:linoleoyl-CoA desaturase